MVGMSIEFVASIQIANQPAATVWPLSNCTKHLKAASEIGDSTGRSAEPPDAEAPTLWEFFGGGSLFPFHAYQLSYDRLFCCGLTTV